jgi:hypothetical protein
MKACTLEAKVGRITDTMVPSIVTDLKTRLKSSDLACTSPDNV